MMGQVADPGARQWGSGSEALDRREDTSCLWPALVQAQLCKDRK